VNINQTGHESCAVKINIVHKLSMIKC